MHIDRMIVNKSFAYNVITFVTEFENAKETAVSRDPVNSI